MLRTYYYEESQMKNIVIIICFCILAATACKNRVLESGIANAQQNNSPLQTLLKKLNTEVAIFKNDGIGIDNPLDFNYISIILRKTKKLVSEAELYIIQNKDDLNPSSLDFISSQLRFLKSEVKFWDVPPSLSPKLEKFQQKKKVIINVSASPRNWRLSGLWGRELQYENINKKWVGVIYITNNKALHLLKRGNLIKIIESISDNTSGFLVQDAYSFDTNGEKAIYEIKSRHGGFPIISEYAGSLSDVR